MYGMGMGGTRRRHGLHAVIFDLSFPPFSGSDTY